jgi:hypothetical protein
MKNPKDNQEWICYDCGEKHVLDLTKLEYTGDVIRWECKCKTVVIGFRNEGEETPVCYTYKLFDGEEICDALQRLHAYMFIPFMVYSELLTHAKFSRWEPFKKIVKQYASKIAANAQLVNFLSVNMLMP